MSRYKSTENCVKVSHHITGFWRPVYTDKPLTTGSIGAGILIDPYTEACYRRGDGPLKIFVNEEEREFPTIKRALSLLEDEVVVPGGIIKISEPLPVSVGYSTSASMTLGALLSLHADLSYSIDKLVKLAHIAEVVEKTGLGDVLALVAGSKLAIRIRPGAPGTGKVISLDMPDGVSIITCAIRAMETRSMLNLLDTKLIDIGNKIFNRFLESPSFLSFLHYSREFSREIGFLEEDLERKINKITDNCVGYYVKKGVIVIICERPYLERVARGLEEEGICSLGVYTHNPVNKGIYMLW